MPVRVRGRRTSSTRGEPVVVELDGHGPRIDGTLGESPQTGGTRADGSKITAGVPSAIPLEGEELSPPTVLDPAAAPPTAVGPD